MRLLFAIVIAIHGLIHLMGFVRGAGLAKVPQLTQPISPAMGALWLAAALVMLAAVIALYAWPRWWWTLGGVALILSQVAIGTSFQDAKFGTVANVILLCGVVIGFAMHGPWSFRQRFEHDTAVGTTQIERAAPPPVITTADIASLPAPLQRYLVVTGAVGQPRVQSYRLRFRGRIRGGPQEAWMPFIAEQMSFTDPPARLFLMTASKSGIPIQAFHRYVGAQATMQVALAGLVTMVDANGLVLDRAETVTLFNDMCILAPGALVSPNIRWETIDARSARGTFTNGPHTISATLTFDADGLLENFVADGRARSSPDGKTFTPLRFSTPVRDYRQYGPIRLAAHGEARWHAPAPDGEFAYGEFELMDIAYNSP